MLFLALTMIAGFQIKLALADIPTVENVEPWTSGSDTILNITVRHALPLTSHYVDKVEVDIDGTIHDVALTPQSTVTFVEPYNMGEVTDTPTVQVRAHCNLHGWSGWSDPLAVPEFSTVSLLLILAIVSIAALLLRSKS